MKKYDAIVIGGGHNGLVNASYLAKAGLKTLVLERRPFIGGAAITEELIPGFKFTTFSYALSLIRPDICQDLDLPSHGMLTLPMPNHLHPVGDGTFIKLGADSYENYHEIAKISQEDAEAMHDFGHIMDRVCHIMKPLVDMIPPNSQSNAPEELEKMAELGGYLEGLDSDVKDMIQRLWNGSIADVLDDYFEHDAVKGMLASSAIIGTMCGPRSKESGMVWLFHKMGEVDGIFGEWGFHKGGNGGFTQCLARAFESFGGTIQFDAAVEQVLRKDGTAFGVKLVDGEEIYAETVVSALDPRNTFLRLVDPAELPKDLVKHIEGFKFQGSAAKCNFALESVPPMPGDEGNTDPFRGFLNIGPDFDYLEAAFKDAQEGRFSKKPFLDCCVQSTIDPDMAPAGKHIMSCFVMWAPYHLKDSDWDSERENLGDAVQAVLEEHFPGFGKLVIHREVVTPLDIERVVGIAEGNIFHGELFADQLFLNRPAPGWNQYRTPITGYYQCGSGTHPGGCVIGAPGKLAAQQVLRDREIAVA
ncbi:MAG: phytoene dehydrogenase-like protein [Candidatus Promineifilaceae bacterium]|jgi:phytoene dehydrogenase-like protein